MHSLIDLLYGELEKRQAFKKEADSMRVGMTEWAHALAGGLSVRGTEGSVARKRHCARGGADHRPN